MPRRAQIRHEAFGIRKGEALVELQPHGGARRHRALAQGLEPPPRRRGAASNSDAGLASRRRQFGCSSIVPGRFGCSVTPSTSSSGINASAAGDCAVKAIAASTAGSGIVRRLAARDARVLERGPERGAIPRALLGLGLFVRQADGAARRDVGALSTSRRRSAGRASSSSRRRRGAIAAGGMNASPSRWNQSTSMPAMPARASRARNSGCTVPRSSPITIGAMAMRLQRDQPQHVVERIGQIRAVGGRGAMRHQPEPRQPHDVIDPHAAGVAQRGAQRREERLEAARDQRLRRKCR